MTACQEELLRLLSKALFSGNIDIQVTDAIQLLQEAKNQAVVQVVYSVLDLKNMSSEDAVQWKKCAASNLTNNIRIFHNHELLHDWMREAEIPYVILKGCASACYYPEPVFRTMGDVDFLVPENRIEAAGNKLQQEGLTPWEEEHISHIVYRSTGMHLEMHFKLAGMPNGEAGDFIRSYTKDIFDRASVQEIGNGYACLPSPFHHGLVLLLHTCHHLTGEGIGLRHLCDWAVFENRFTDSEFRNTFEKPLTEIGLWRFAQILTRISIKYLNAEEREWAVCDDDIVDALMEDILAGGNFGRKDNSRLLQTLLISNRGKDGVGRTNMLTQFFQSINGVVYLHWPLTRKCKLLLPAGWVYLGGKRLIRELNHKKKKIEFRHIIDRAGYRRALYQKLQLFEREDSQRLS